MKESGSADGETSAYLSLGSNLGNREEHLDAALNALGGLPGTVVEMRSPVYVTEPWGPVDQPNYLNMVAVIRTRLEPLRLLRECKGIECAEGRVPGERWGPRPLDIDILLYDDMEIRSSRLQVPHPRMWERAFVLRPLADLSPDLKGPDGAAITDWLQRPVIASQRIWRHGGD